MGRVKGEIHQPKEVYHEKQKFKVKKKPWVEDLSLLLSSLSVVNL